MIWILLLGTMALSMWPRWRVKAIYNRFNQSEVRSGSSGASWRRNLSDAPASATQRSRTPKGCSGQHCEPLHKGFALSAANYFGRTSAASGVAAHECGHALQPARVYKPLHGRSGLSATVLGSVASGGLVGSKRPLLAVCAFEA